MKSLINKMMRGARTGALAAFHAAQNIGSAENWVLRLRAEAFGEALAQEISELSPKEASALKAEAIRVFESLLSAEDRARIEAGRKASASSDSDIESESMGAAQIEIKNLTPHVLNIVAVDGSTVNIQPSGAVARVSAKTETVGNVNGIAVTKSVFGDIIDLPAAVDGVVLVVSRMVKDRVANRADVMVPGAPVRNAEGQIIGANGLSL